MSFWLKIFTPIIFLFCISDSVLSQRQWEENEKEYDPTKLKIVAGGGVAFYAGTIIGLSTIWYRDKDKTYLHLFNDNESWMQIDKFGHMYTSYIMGKGGYKSLMWTGLDRKKAIWFGGSYGFLFLSTIEIIDGHYREWGFSVGDVVANALGSALFIGQELSAGSQVVTMKFSYQPTDLAKYRQDQLGSGTLERVIKDYNGQTFWFSANYRSIFRNHGVVPKWLNIAGGYGAYGMLGGHSNPEDLPKFERYRSYYLSLDLDLDRIKTKSKFVNSVFFFLNLLKIPLPTLEYNEKGEFIFHPIYF